MKDEWFDRFMKEFITIGPKVYGFSQFKYDGSMKQKWNKKS